MSLPASTGTCIRFHHRIVLPTRNVSVNLTCMALLSIRRDNKFRYLKAVMKLYKKRCPDASESRKCYTLCKLVDEQNMVMKLLSSTNQTW